MKRILLVIFPLLLLCQAAFGAGLPVSRWADFDGGKVHYYEVGKRKAKAIVFIHGWACSADFWRESVSAFPGYRVLALDLAGHGKSDKPQAVYSMDYLARSVEAVLSHAGVTKAVLVGHSMGTPVARQVYRRGPETVAGIVIVDGALRPMGSLDTMEAFYAPLRANYGQTSKGMIHGMTNQIKDGKLRDFINSTMTSTPEHVGLKAMEAFGERAIWKEDKINVPVLAVMADSPAWKPDEREFFASIAPDLRFSMWKGVSHFLMMEKPAEFNAEVAAFLKEKKLLK